MQGYIFGWRKTTQLQNVKMDSTILLLIEYLNFTILLKTKCLKKKGQKLYAAFDDFRKPFDSVRHDKLLEIKGLGGSCLVLSGLVTFLYMGQLQVLLSFSSVLLGFKDVW